MGNSTDLRVVKTRENIKNTLKEMICEMDADRITVKELSQRARIHRQTFYLHYPSMDELLDEMVGEILERFLSLWTDDGTPMTYAKLHRGFFLKCTEMEKHEERILCSPGYSEYRERLFNAGIAMIREHFNAYREWPEDIQEMIFHHIMVCFLEFFRQWVTSGKKISMEELTFITDKLMYNGLSGFITAVPHPGGH